MTRREKAGLRGHVALAQRGRSCQRRGIMTAPAWITPAIPPAQLDAAQARLPQMNPVAEGAWLTRDCAFSAQLAEKARLIALDRSKVIGLCAGAEEAASELLDVVLAEIAGKGYVVDDTSVLRPDNVRVMLDRDDPLLTLSQLVQEDFCIHQKRDGEDEHRLTAALLCFPAAWTLSEKLGHKLTRIHVPVAPYTDEIAMRVQRFFDMVRFERPLWRANLLRYDDPSLFQPHTEAAPRPVGTPTSPYWRSERQSLRRLPKTGAVVFSIHTTMCLA